MSFGNTGKISGRFSPISGKRSNSLFWLATTAFGQLLKAPGPDARELAFPFAIADAAATGLRNRLTAGDAAAAAQKSRASAAAQARSAMAYFQKQGWKAHQAAAIVGNGVWESGLNPGARGDGGEAVGAFQWHLDRQRAFQRWSGGQALAGSTLAQQLAFAQYELTQGGERRAGDALRRAPDLRSATAAVMFGYERPASSASFGGRLALAAGAYERPASSASFGAGWPLRRARMNVRPAVPLSGPAGPCGGPTRHRGRR